jgi:hypothetical protein
MIPPLLINKKAKITCTQAFTLAERPDCKELFLRGELNFGRKWQLRENEGRTFEKI